MWRFAAVLVLGVVVALTVLAIAFHVFPGFDDRRDRRLLGALMMVGLVIIGLGAEYIAKRRRRKRSSS